MKTLTTQFTQNTGRGKFILIAVLAVVFLGLAIYRLGPKIGGDGSVQTASADLTTQFKIPVLKGALKNNVETENESLPLLQLLEQPVRDIFEFPMQLVTTGIQDQITAAVGGAVVNDLATAGEMVQEAAAVAYVPPDYQLQGTIVGLGEPIAVIDNRFFKTGDRIGDFEVTRIDGSSVQLRSDLHDDLRLSIDNSNGG